MLLDPQQMLAVTTDSKHALVLAGAGSGKTRVLIERIAYLIEQQKVSPYEIMAFTFTRKAAGEIKTRLEDRIGKKAYRCTMGTMHALGLQMVQRFGDLIGLKTQSTTVYCEWEASYLLKEIAKELGYFKKSWNPPKEEIDEMFADYYERGMEPDENHRAHDLFITFIDRCKENNALTYGALLIGLQLLVPAMAKYLHFRHILVDEIQDIDPLQWRIINLMCREFKAHLFVVGDIDQSIYEFRGAVPKYLVDHQLDFDIFRIETNYRSDADIVNAANRLIAFNQDRIEKTMKALKDGQTPIKIERNMDSLGICKLIKKLEEKSPGVDRAILGRNHYLLIKLSALMKDAKIAHTYIGRKAALTNSENFRRFHAFLKLIVNPYDNFSFLLIRDLIGISPEEYTGIRLKAMKEGKSHFKIWYNEYENGWTAFYDSIEQWSFNSLIGNLHSIFDPSLSDWLGETNTKRPDFQNVVDFIMEWNKNTGFIEGYPTEALQDYLNWLATYDLQDELTDDKPGIQLMTIHAAKGLEWPTVILTGLNEEILPSKQSIAKDDIESERRLCYVGMTRAEDQLILAIRPEVKVSDDGRLYRSPMSRFVREAM